MPLVDAHELVLALACCFGMLSVLLGGELPTLSWLCLGVLPLSAWLRLYHRPLPVIWGTALALATFVSALLLVMRHGVNYAMVGATLGLMGMLVTRLLTRSMPSHDLHALTLSLALVFAATLLHQQFTFGITLVCFSLCTTVALVTRQMLFALEMMALKNDARKAQHVALKRRDIVTPAFVLALIGVGCVILFAGSLLFALFPRIGLGHMAQGHDKTQGLPAHVSLAGEPWGFVGTGTVARLANVPYSEFVRGLYLRARVYDAMDGHNFVSGSPLKSVPDAYRLPAVMGDAFEVGIFLEPLGETHLVSLGPVLGVSAWRGGSANPSLTPNLPHVGTQGELISESVLAGPVRYKVLGPASRPYGNWSSTLSDISIVTPMPKDLGPSFTHRYLSLPKDLDPRIPALARLWADKAGDPRRIVDRVRTRLMAHATYTTQSSNNDKPDPLASFLFEDPRGHCEYFASAYATMLRAMGVPSRLVGGFMGGSWESKEKMVIFSAINAHAWVEVFLPGIGWVLDDATPPIDAAVLSAPMAWLERMRRLWDDTIVDYALSDQVALLGAIGQSMQDIKLTRPSWRLLSAMLVILIGAAAGTFFLRKRRRFRRSGASQPLAKALVRYFRRHKTGPLVQNETFLEAAMSLTRTKELSRQDLIAIINVYEQQRFGGAKALTRRELRALIERL